MSRKKSSKKAKENSDSSDKAKGSKIWSFEDQMKVGAKGERFLLKNWPDPVRKHETFKGPDFRDSQGRVIELKTDTYELDKTPYFFFERFSDFHAKKPGGPWQALEKGSTCFVYLFLNGKTWFVFEDLPALVKRCEELTQHSYAISIRNRAWITSGFKILRDNLKDLFRMETFK